MRLDGRNCAAHLLATALGQRELFEAHEYPGEFEYETVSVVCELAKKHGHACYFLKNGALLYKHVSNHDKQDLAYVASCHMHAEQQRKQH